MTRPTHFVGLRLPNFNQIKLFHDYVEANQPDYQNFLTWAHKSHITLFVLACNEEQVKQVVDKFQQVAIISKKLYTSAPSFHVKGLGTFGSKEACNVLYAIPRQSPEESLKLKQLQSELTNLLLEFITDTRPWTPHVTLMKSRGRGIIPKTVFQDWLDYDFGIHTTPRLEFNSMSEVDDDGYYKCIASVNIS